MYGKSPAPFLLEGDISKRWKIWIDDFNSFLQASNLNGKPGRTKVVVFLHCVGKQCRDIYKQFVLDGKDRDGEENNEDNKTINENILTIDENKNGNSKEIEIEFKSNITNENMNVNEKNKSDTNNKNRNNDNNKTGHVLSYDFEALMLKFDEYFSHQKKSSIFLRNQFLTARQKGDETFKDFFTRVRKLSEDCDLGHLQESLLKDLLIIGAKVDSFFYLACQKLFLFVFFYFIINNQ